MAKMIEILDCTLRDGAHINNGYFGSSTVKRLVQGLIDSGLHYVEVGFLQNCEFDPNRTFYPQISVFDELISGMGIVGYKKKLTLMLRPDRVNIEAIKQSSEILGSIRIAFYYEYLSEAVKYADVARNYGYNVFFNPIVITHYSANELASLIDAINDVQPSGVSIVDTFGALTVDNVDEIFQSFRAVDNNIKIGLHFHENLLQSLSLIYKAISFFKDREIILDGSVYGMGRAPGNVATELLVSNFDKKSQIFLNEIICLINECIAPLKNKYCWGYSPEYFLSGIYNVHRDYAEFFLDKGFDLKVLQEIFDSLVLNSFGSRFSNEIAQKYYNEFIDI